MPIKKAKDLVIESAGVRGFVVKWSGGGELPAVLKTAYTSPAEAQLAINLFKAIKSVKKRA